MVLKYYDFTDIMHIMDIDDFLYKNDTYWTK